ncbi:MAG: dihydropteroate synthase [Gammaproteobacteria bacterium]|nr:dihydropteroate synthase [Gammaproteobacteria bacterium]
MKLLDHQQPMLMGIVNVTPDSFSDGGRFFDHGLAVAHAEAMVEEGADIIDVGGESTRPGAQRVAAAEQIRRTLPVIQRLRGQLPLAVGVSIDTTSAEVAREALDAGASLINDISAGRDDPEMLAVAAEKGVPIVLMHMQGTPATMQDEPRYENVVEEIRDFLLRRVDAALAAGVARDRIIIDPGIGFGKSRRHNLVLMAHLPRFTDTGLPVLLGASRKRFMGSICAEQQSDELVGATCAATVLGVLAGVRILRVHDVKANRQAMQVAWAIKEAGRS